jgi:phage gp36-like protein
MTIDDDLIDLWALDADDEIDTACNGRYTVPFNPVPKLIERIATVLTMYYLCQRWGSDNPYKALYDWAMKKLAGIADGSISIIGIDEADSFASSGELEAGIEWAEFNPETDNDTRKDFIEP